MTPLIVPTRPDLDSEFARIVDELTRRGFLAGGLGGAAMLGLAACGSPGRGPTGTGYSSTAGMRMVKTVYGDIEVPAEPKRIVALYFPEAMALADLGIKPIGVGNYIPPLLAYSTFFKDVPIITDGQSVPEIDKIAALKPDLILGDTYSAGASDNAKRYKQLSAIAPTAIFEWTSAGGNWQAEAAGTACAVGETSQMNSLRDDFFEYAEQIKKAYARTLATHTVDLVSANDAANWDLYGPSSSHGKVLAAAGARFGAAENQQDGYVQYSSEEYTLLNETNIVIVASSAPNDPGLATNVTSSPVFTRVPAATNRNVFTTPYFFPASYQMAHALLDAFAHVLKEAN